MKIAIASGKGGTGKTTVSTNLASYMAEKQSVVLVDLDVEEPNSGLFVKGDLVHREVTNKMIPSWIKEGCTLCGICQNVCNFNAIIKLGPMIMVFPELCHGCYACSELCPKSVLPMVAKGMGTLSRYKNDRLDFVESRLDIGEEQAVPLIAQTIKYVEEHFDDNHIKIYDAPPGTSCSVIEATKAADFVILVTEPTPFGLHDLTLAADTMKQLKKAYGVIINRYGIGNDDVLAYCEENDIPVIAKIPNSRQIAELYASGELVYKKIPAVKKAMEEMAAYIFSIKKEVKP